MLGDDISEWMKMAEDNLNTAELLYQNGRYKDTCFYCQQIMEKVLKAVQIKKLKRFDKIHFLPDLADSVKAPKNIQASAKKLTSYYVFSRYPLPENRTVTEDEAEEAISAAKEVVEWAKSILK